jgi:hypothetical protein
MNPEPAPEENFEVRPAVTRDASARADPDYPPDAADPRPWEEPGTVRRDCEPHRAGLLRGLGIASLVAPFAGLVISPLIGFVAGISLGITVYVLARGDLAKMDDGIMDPDGRPPTRTARGLGLAGILLSLGLLVLGVLVVIAFISLASH